MRASVTAAGGDDVVQTRALAHPHARTVLLVVAWLLGAVGPSAAQTIVAVQNAAQLHAAVEDLTSNTTIVLAPGTYRLDETLTVAGPVADVTIRGATGRADDVVLLGPGMETAEDSLHGIETVGAVTRLTVSDLSIREFPGSCVYLGAGASRPHVRNLHLVNSGRTFVDTEGPDDDLPGASAGIVEYSRIEFVLPKFARATDVGGVHVRGGADWVIRGNTIRWIWKLNDPHDPDHDRGPALPAILADEGSSGTLVERNRIIDSQQGIAFGSTDGHRHREHVGGIIRTNIVYRSGLLEPLGTGGRVGILVADSPGTRIAHNTVFQNDGYADAIVYRHPASGVIIKNNLVNRRIRARDLATATLTNNSTRAEVSTFVAYADEDLHLVRSATIAIDAGAAVTADDGLQDIDGQARGVLPDIGADEFEGVGPSITTAGALPPAAVAIWYSVPLVASGGLPPLAWSGVVTGVLPPGLRLSDGVIEGVPTSDGSYEFSVRVAASDGAFADRIFNLAVDTMDLYPLTVTRAGTGSGTVTSSPAGIACGSDCGESYAAGTEVTLIATAAAGSRFTGWSGDADCSDATVTLTTARACRATFETILYPLTVTRAGTGSGTVTSSPAGIACGSDCSESYTSGTEVTLIATAAPGSRFAGWSGGGSCSDGKVKLTTDRTCQATFETILYPLTVTRAGTGSGTVTSSPAGIACGSDCSESYASGTEVTLIATAAPGSRFAGWSGGGSCSDGKVKLTTDRTCQATFDTTPTPTITRVTPTAGPLAGGTSITITGTNFQTGMTVSVGGLPLTGLVVENTTTIRALTPPAASAGVREVAVRTPNGAASLPDGFTYSAESTSHPLYTISGTITDLNDTPVSGITVGLSGGRTETAITDADGAYVFTNLPSTNFTVTPVRQGFTFSPIPRSIALLATNEDVSFVAQTGAFARYLAEGATGDLFDTQIALFNATGAPTTARLTFLKPDGTTQVTDVPLAGLERRTIVPESIAGLDSTAFSTVVESDQPIAVDRTMTWDSTRYGSHAETGIVTPLTRWFFAEGATTAGFDLFYLVQNPNATPATVAVRYLLASGAPFTKTYSIAPRSRFNVWVNLEDQRLAAAEVSADITSDLPVIVERAMYRSGGGQSFAMGHESAGVPQASAQWFFAEGATGSFFDLFFLIANPTDQQAQVEATYLKPDGSTVVKTYAVAPNSRFNIWVDFEDPALAATAVGTTFRVTNGVAVVVERSMWWAGDFTRWVEGHNTAGATKTGSKWALAEGEVSGAPFFTDTFLLVANTGTTAGTVRVTLVFEDGTAPLSKELSIAGSSRLNVSVRDDFPEAIGKRFGSIVESVGATRLPLVVERAMYNRSGSVDFAAGTAALGARLR